MARVNCDRNTGLTLLVPVIFVLGCAHGSEDPTTSQSGTKAPSDKPGPESQQAARPASQPSVVESGHAAPSQSYVKHVESPGVTEDIKVYVGDTGRAAAYVGWLSSDHSAGLRDEAIRKLIKIGEPAVMPLIEDGLASEKPQVRWYAKRILASIGTPAKEQLKKALSHRNPNVARGASEALDLILKGDKLQSFDEPASGRTKKVTPEDEEMP